MQEIIVQKLNCKEIITQKRVVGENCIQENIFWESITRESNHRESILFYIFLNFMLLCYTSSLKHSSKYIFLNIFINFMFLRNTFKLNTYLRNIFPKLSLLSLSFRCNNFPRFTFLIIIATHSCLYFSELNNPPSPQ